MMKNTKETRSLLRFVAKFYQLPIRGMYTDKLADRKTRRVSLWTNASPKVLALVGDAIRAEGCSFVVLTTADRRNVWGYGNHIRVTASFK